MGDELPRRRAVFHAHSKDRASVVASEEAVVLMPRRVVEFQSKHERGEAKRRRRSLRVNDTESGV